eukprot:2465987-Amphidinium_carterae.1
MTTLSQGPVPYYIGATWGIPHALHDILEAPLGEQACLLEPYLALPNDVTMTCLPTSARKQACAILEQARLELLRRELNADLVADLLRPLFLELYGECLHFSSTSHLDEAQLARLLFQHIDPRGCDVRIDLNHFMRPGLWPRRPIDIHRWKWKVVCRWHWRHGTHITLKETSATLAAVKWRFKHECEWR